MEIFNESSSKFTLVKYIDINDTNKLRGYNIGTMFYDSSTGKLYVKDSPNSVSEIISNVTGEDPTIIITDEFDDYIESVLNTDCKEYENKY